MHDSLISRSHTSKRVVSHLLRSLLLAVICQSLAVFAQSQVPSPRSILGFTPGDDRTIADWRQITDYFQKLDTASDRVAVKEIGKSTLGRPLIVAFISASHNIRDLEKFRTISSKLANPARSGPAFKNGSVEDLIKRGKTVVAISCSIHSTEIVASQMSMELAYQLASSDDSETREILENTILLLVPSPNPDGIDIVADWYRKTLGTKSEGTSPPELYHHYAGHDNNRDWFMLNLRETQALTKLFWQEWYPQIVYDIHQMGQDGARLVLPPFFDPPNPRISPRILREVAVAGSKMANDLQAAGVKGVATNTTFDTWWHGGFRSAPYFHNSIGILSEAASADLMSPVTVGEDKLKKFRGARGLASPLISTTAHPDPWTGGTWRASDIAAMEIKASRALLQLAAKYRTHYLRAFYEMARANLSDRPDQPRAFVIPAGQPNAEAVSRFLEILMWQGIEVHELTREIYLKHEKNSGEFHEMPLGSFLVYTSQPQRNNIISLFEKQVYPDRRAPNGEAEAPYDIAGWTLPLQMGIEIADVWEIRDPAGLKRVAGINQVREVLNLPPARAPFDKLAYPLKTRPRIGVYRGYTSSMDEGWTRFVLDTYQIPFRSVSTRHISDGLTDLDVLIIPSENEKTITEGLSADRYPAEFAGGIGAAGVEQLRKFVDGGGKIICFDKGCSLVIRSFGLPLRNTLEGVKRTDFFNPGSIIKLDVNTAHPIARGTRNDTAAFFISSSAFEVAQDAKVTSVARYASKDVLLSGWMIGEKYIKGKTAIAETDYGNGKIVLFAFRPQHRGQTFGTFPFIFNALEK